MADEAADDTSGDDTTGPSAEAELGAAVDDAVESELKRQRARFVRQIMSVDRWEGVGRRGERWDDSLDRELGVDRPDDPAD